MCCYKSIAKCVLTFSAGFVVGCILPQGAIVAITTVALIVLSIALLKC